MSAPRRRALIFLGVLVLVAALLVARGGTVRSRGVSLAFLVTFVGATFFLRKRERDVWKDPKRALSRISVGMPELGARATRAMSLLERGDGTSPDLAALHVARSVSALPQDKIEATASRFAGLYGAFSVVFAALTFAALVLNPWGLVEGADILFARKGTAPLPLVWLVDLDVMARPPDYLHEAERRVSDSEAQLANGSLITVRGTPVHDGRRLFLSDGQSEVPLVADGTGKVVARWPLSGDSTLRVLARFGDVVVEEPRSVNVHAIMDETPVVHLEGAPRKVLLTDPEPSDIEIRYEATDDHALREVHLVLRSGARDERRVLARVEGETRRDSGGYVVRLSDPFLKKSHAPIEITVEAKDNDPVTGPKWGVSEAITVVPPNVGEPEAQRLEALRELRNTLVDALAYRLAHEVPTARAERDGFLAEEKRWTHEASEQLDKIVEASYSGARLAGRLRAILRGQARKCEGATEAEQKAPNGASHTALLKATERYTLVVDAMMAGLGQKDSRDVSLKLAEVVDELAATLGMLDRDRGRSESERVKASQRVETTIQVVRGGEKALLRLGALGRDIGEIVNAYLSRVERAQKANDAVHAVLAAQDLSARLHQPDPSFGSKGKGRGGTGESSGGGGMPSDGDGEGSDVERAFNEAAQDLERLTEDHAGNIGKVEQAISGAENDEDERKLKEEGKKHAEAVRQAIKGLPSVGGGSDTWTGKGALGREHAEQMARSFEQGNPADAVSAGQNALQALDEARKLAARTNWDRSDSEATTDDAKRKLEAEQRWATAQLETLRKKASERARGDLQKRAEDESKLAERTRALGEKGREGESMPEAAIDALDSAERLARSAADALKQGNTERALEEQRKAQQKLESARQAMSDESEGASPKGEGDGDRLSKERADIPKADAHKGPEEFRRRVMKGLGQSGSGKERDAVKRYAEGLLR